MSFVISLKLSLLPLCHDAEGSTSLRDESARRHGFSTQAHSSLLPIPCRAYLILHHRATGTQHLQVCSSIPSSHSNKGTGHCFRDTTFRVKRSIGRKRFSLKQGSSTTSQGLCLTISTHNSIQTECYFRCQTTPTSPHSLNSSSSQWRLRVPTTPISSTGREPQSLRKRPVRRPTFHQLSHAGTGKFDQNFETKRLGRGECPHKTLLPDCACFSNLQCRSDRPNVSG